MVDRARTKDESFMLKLHQEALKLSDIEDPLDRYQIGALCGLQPKAVDTICTLLAQANFIKKQGKIDVSMTQHGIRLVESLLHER